MAPSKTQELSDIGVSIWLDDLSRERIESGGLQKLIDERNVVGVTTNPTIFATALAKGNAYDSKVAELAAQGTSVHDAVFEIITHDVATACDVFRPVYDATGGQDGRVSIEVEPGLAHDTAGTIGAGRAALGEGRPDQRDDQDPRDQGGPRRHHRRDRRRASAST